MTDDLVKLGRAVERDLNNGFPMTCERGVIIQQMADRIEELEAKLTVSWDTQAVKILVISAYKEGWADGADNVPLGSGWEKSLTNATLAELKGHDDE